MNKIEDKSVSVPRRRPRALIESEDAVSLSGLMEETRLPKTTTARLLRALERNGLAQRRGAVAFARPGARGIRAEDSAVGSRDPCAAVPRTARRDDGRDGEHRHPDPAGVARLAQVDSNHPWEPATGSAVASRSTRRRWARSSWLSAPARSAASLASALDDHLSGNPVRRARSGSAGRLRDDVEELDEGLCSAAAPVYGARGSVIAAISVSAPTVRTSRERLLQVAQQVVDEACALSELIRLYHPEGVRGHERRRDSPGSTTTPW